MERRNDGKKGQRDVRKRPWAKEREWHLKAGKGWEQIIPFRCHKEHSAVGP